MDMSPRFLMGVLGIAVLASAVWLVSARQGSTQSPADDHVKLELVSEQDAFVSGEELLVGIRFILEEGWHTYWINPGDSGEPPRVQWHLPADAQAGEIKWPYPKRLSTPPFADFGYEHQVLLVVPIRVPPTLKEGETEKITAQVRYLICRDVCIPGQKQLELSLPVKNRAAPSPARELFAASRAKIPGPTPPNWKISVTSLGEEFVLNLQTGEPTRVVQFFPLYPEQIENAASQEVTVFSGGVRLHLKKSSHLLTPVARLEGIIVVDSERGYSINVPVSRSMKNGAQIAE